MEREEPSTPAPAPAPAPPCPHYRTRCQLKAQCCGRFVGCHHCHNGDYEHECGLMERSAVAAVRCRECRTVTSPPAATCSNEACGVRFAEYFCAKCNLFREGAAAGIFHCDGCGICRLGGGLGPGGSHWHCHGCCACLPNSIDRTAHLKVCLPAALKGECPICFEDLHGSRDPCVPGANCGHYLHKKCLDQFLRSGRDKCPMCTAPLVNYVAAATTMVREVARNIAQQPGRPAAQPHRSRLAKVFCGIFAVVLLVVVAALVVDFIDEDGAAESESPPPLDL
jgi:hypothetical protein